MIESPVLDEAMAICAARQSHEDILEFLTVRFGSVPEEVAAAVRTTHEKAKLKELVRAAASSHTLKAFGEHLTR
jgi:hypothetical protein